MSFKHQKHLIYCFLIFIYVSPFFRQVLDFKTAFIRPWVMFNFIGNNVYRIDCWDIDSENEKWVDVSRYTNGRMFFRSKKTLNNLKQNLPSNYKCQVKQETSKGFKEVKL